MIENFINPIKLEDILDRSELSINQWGHQIDFYTPNDDTFLWNDYQLALIGIDGIAENRQPKEGNISEAANLIRASFFRLFNWEKSVRLVDLGNVKVGETRRQTYQNFIALLEMLLEKNMIPIIIGGTHDFTYPQFVAYEQQDTPINMVVIDETVDLFTPETSLPSQSFLYQILAHQPNYIGSFSQIAFQKFLVNPDMVSTLEKFHFNCHRLGEFKTSIKHAEPVVRNADIISFDVSSLQANDAPAQRLGSPNGLTGAEACQIMRYAGFGEGASSLGLYEYFPEKDTEDKRTAQLLGQLIWHFIEGFASRRYEYPNLFEEDFTVYKTLIGDSQVLDFVRSRHDEKWWIKVPVMDGDEVDRNELIPCTYEDYLQARDFQEIPDRWMKHLIRLSK